MKIINLIFNVFFIIIILFTSNENNYRLRFENIKNCFYFYECVPKTDA